MENWYKNDAGLPLCRPIDSWAIHSYSLRQTTPFFRGSWDFKASNPAVTWQVSSCLGPWNWISLLVVAMVSATRALAKWSWKLQSVSILNWCIQSGLHGLYPSDVFDFCFVSCYAARCTVMGPVAQRTMGKTPITTAAQNCWQLVPRDFQSPVTSLVARQTHLLGRASSCTHAAGGFKMFPIYMWSYSDTVLKFMAVFKVIPFLFQ